MNGVNWRDIMWCFIFLPSICEQSINRLWRHRCTASVNWYNCFNRNIFDSCVKSWEFFRSDNISLETSFSWLFDDIVRFKIDMGVVKKCTKMSTPFSMDFPHTPRQWRHSTPSLSITSLSLAGVYCTSTLLGRCLCKRVDVYIITILCTWQIYALFERLLVVVVGRAFERFINCGTYGYASCYLGRGCCWLVSTRLRSQVAVVERLFSLPVVETL